MGIDGAGAETSTTPIRHGYGDKNGAESEVAFTRHVSQFCASTGSREKRWKRKYSAQPLYSLRAHSRHASTDLIRIRV